MSWEVAGGGRCGGLRDDVSMAGAEGSREKAARKEKGTRRLFFPGPYGPR
jgi:hypothetical protein